MDINVDNRYTKMQLNWYNERASYWTEMDRNHVIGSYKKHNDWEDYENLFLNLDNQSELIGLDWACGPGRNIVKYHRRFKQLDGVDISPINISKAISHLETNKVPLPNLYVSNGVNLDIIESNKYDFVMSTIALQHICVYEIRYSILSEVYRVLKPNGIITFQMGFGSPVKSTVGYYENFYDAQATNGKCDVCVESTDQIESDLLKIGFKEFKYVIGPTGPSDRHPNWIYFNAIK